MPRLTYKVFSCFMLCAVLTACATTPTLTDVKYDSNKRSLYYSLEQWEFEGRAALLSASASENPYINWRHRHDADSLRLSGPLGQGAVSVKISGSRIEIDRGDGQTEVSDHPDELLQARTGMLVPVAALRYWVLGLPEAGRDFEADAEGFRQSGWTVRYPQWMRVGADEMPHKISVHNENFKLKLVIDQWILPHENAQ